MAVFSSFNLTRTVKWLYHFRKLAAELDRATLERLFPALAEEIYQSR